MYVKQIILIQGRRTSRASQKMCPSILGNQKKTPADLLPVQREDLCRLAPGTGGATVQKTGARPTTFSGNRCVCVCVCIICVLVHCV